MDTNYIISHRSRSLRILIALALLPCSSYGRSMSAPRDLAEGEYGTHMVPLITAVINTTGPVLEMGSGDFSTPLLHTLCASHKRFLLTTESDQAWLSLFLDLENDLHNFIYVPVFDNCANQDRMAGGKPELWDSIGLDRHWGVVFIDHAPGLRRIIDVQRLRNNADIIVVHDTQAVGYQYEPILSSFNYKFVYTRYNVTTTLVSDTIDVAKLFE